MSRRVTPSFFPWGFHFRQGLQNFVLYLHCLNYLEFRTESQKGRWRHVGNADKFFFARINNFVHKIILRENFGKFPDSLESFRSAGKFKDSEESFWTVWKVPTETEKVSGESEKFSDSIKKIRRVQKVFRQNLRFAMYLATAIYALCTESESESFGPEYYL